MAVSFVLWRILVVVFVHFCRSGKLSRRRCGRQAPAERPLKMVGRVVEATLEIVNP